MQKTTYLLPHFCFILPQDALQAQGVYFPLCIIHFPNIHFNNFSFMKISSFCVHDDWPQMQVTFLWVGSQMGVYVTEEPKKK